MLMYKILIMLVELFYNCSAILQRFILNKASWAHLDIAGMAFSKYGGEINQVELLDLSVRLLNQLVEENYE